MSSWMGQKNKTGEVENSFVLVLMQCHEMEFNAITNEKKQQTITMQWVFGFMINSNEIL
jgi:hypothetical protein